VPATPNGTHVYVSLAAIAACVPESISHKVPANGDQFVAIPLEFIVPQLSQGQVVLTGAELVASSTEFFGALTPQDEVSVSLPLADVLQQVPKEYFVRKNKRKIEVPAEVASVFAANGHGVSIARPPAAPASPTAPAYRAQPAVTSTSAQPVPAPTAPAAKISISPSSLAAMKAATGAPTPVVTASPARPSAPAPRAITPAPATPAVTSAPAPLPRVAAPAPAPMVKKVAPAALKNAGELAVPLASVAPDWDQEVRRQLTDVDLQQHQVLVPLELLEPAMKSGKVLFSWAEVASWIQPPLPSPPTPKVGEMPVELPLKVIAPLFMANQNGAAHKRVSVDESIPDLFGGGAKENGHGHASTNAQIQTPLRAPQTPAPWPAPARATTPAPAPVARTVPTPLPVAFAEPEPAAAPAPAPAVEDISADAVIGAEGSRFGAKEIVLNTSRLPGVAGALLAMSDGLLVTSATPPAVKGETIAAFLPQMFGRMNQYTKELALGPLQQLTLGIESGQWHVVKGPNIYFAVLGKRGETLPLNLLAQVAAELSIQSK